MVELGTEGSAASQKPAEEAALSVIKEAGAQDTLLAQAGQQTEEQKQAQIAEETRLLEADETTLSEEEKGKRNILVKTRDDKKLLDTPDDQLSEEDKVKKAEIVKVNEAKAKPGEAPEKYEDFKIPEGMIVDKTLIDKVSPIFKELKLTQEGAQKLVDVYNDTMKANAEAQVANFKQFLKTSYDETVKELGANYKDQLAYVAKVRDRFLSEETQEILDASGLSNNKAFILDLIKLGKLISEDKLPPGSSATPAGEKSAAQTLYGKD